MEQATTTDTTLLSIITNFINEIGIPCKQTTIDYDTFLPGADIRDGQILYDPKKLLSPGDLLHEAGHIAVLQPDTRRNVTSPNISGDIQEGAAEMAAIAWSWAALTHLHIAPEVVFHPEGYHGGSDNIMENFHNQRYFGASMLQWLGMTVEHKKGMETNGTYPCMTHLLRP